jgi:malate dehydrogenase
MVEAIAGRTDELLPVCAWCTGEYGIDGVYVGVPVRLSTEGIRGIAELDLSGDELEALRAAAEGIRSKCRDLASL